jgi:hypothetical protein
MNISDIKPWEHFDHIVMNLPASALEFLGMFHLIFLFVALLRYDNLTSELPQIGSVFKGSGSGLVGIRCYLCFIGVFYDGYFHSFQFICEETIRRIN